MNSAHGTDPTEGSALAISILENLFNKNTLTIATTHYPEIKNYALVTPGFENASSEFDLENLKPTYKLLIGIPGKSNAFEISKKLGLDLSIINRAKSFIDTDKISVEELLKKIYDDKVLIEKQKDETMKNLSQIEFLRKSLETEKDKLQEKENTIIEQAKQEARKILLDAKEDVSLAIKEINKTYKNIDENSISNLNNTRNKLNTSIKNTISNDTTKQASPSIDKNSIYIGMKVHSKTLKQTGTIVTLPNKANQVQVQFANAKMTLNIEDIVEATNNSKKASIGTASYKINKVQTATSEINVIGYNVEEAIFVIDKYLDDCVLAKLSPVRIVHGKGTGILRKGIHEFLKKNPHVKNFRLGTFGEGEIGVTIVEIEEK